MENSNGEAAQIVRAGQAIYSLDGVNQTQGPATFVVRDGIITDIQPGADAECSENAREVIEVPDDRILIPGLVDTHVHVNEPGRTEWEGFASATRAAAAGGVTTLIDMPLNSIPSTITMDALRTKQDVAREKIKVNVGFWGGVTPDNLGTGELRKLWESGRVFGFKCFLLHSGVDEFQPLTPAQLEEAMAEIAEFDGQLIVHAEDAEIIERAEAECTTAADPTPGSGITNVYSTFEASRPPEAEATAIATVIAASEKTGCRAHILHLSDSGSLEQLKQAQDRGIRITAETCPHYLSLFSEEIQNGATQYKCCPPIRTAGNRERLWAGLVDGVIGMVVSDHSPCTAELKKFEKLDTSGQFSALAAEGNIVSIDGADSRGGEGSFGAAWGGVASVQLGLPVIWSQARLRGLRLTDVVEWMATAPARWAGLNDRGILTPGARADFVAVSADEAFVVLPENLHHKNKVTAYAQRALAGVVQQTWIGGQTVYRRPQVGEPIADLSNEERDSAVFPGIVAALVERP